eukprot:3234062-Lingulodinium_polyedra.AAC.1
MARERQLQRIEGSMPQKASGGLVVTKALREEIKEQYQGLGRNMPLATYQRICLLHGRRWRALDPAERARYEAMAEAFKEEEADAL